MFGTKAPFTDFTFKRLYAGMYYVSHESFKMVASAEASLMDVILQVSDNYYFYAKINYDVLWILRVCLCKLLFTTIKFNPLV